MNSMIEKFINKMTKDDIIKFSNSNNLTISNDELNFIFTFIKTNYKNILADPNSFNLEEYKDKFSEENYLFIEKMLNKYKRMIIR